MEIKVGEYVRTSEGKIYKLLGEQCYLDNRGETVNFIENIIKHSFNLIDLIEVGDLLEIELSEEFVEKEDKNVFTRLGDVYTKETLQRDVDNGIVINIKTILTHEQYEENCYKITTNDKLNS